MCLSTVYKNEKTPQSILMRNVTAIECREGMVILTDLMDQTCAIQGTLALANLVEGFVIVNAEA